MAAAVFPGSLAAVVDSKFTGPVTLQVLEPRIGATQSLLCNLTDGVGTVTARLSPLTAAFLAGELGAHDLVTLQDYTCTPGLTGGTKMLIATSAVVAQRGVASLTAPVPKGASVSPASVFAHVDSSPVAAASPLYATPVATSARGATQPTGSQPRRTLPIAGLNPYLNNWTIKARVASKGELRTYNNARGGGKVFDCELVDAEGTGISATAWKEHAERLHPLLEVNAVYYISRGRLEPANKKYSTLPNDYAMTLGAETDVERVADGGEGDAASMHMKLEATPIDRLAELVGRDKTVDVIALVTHVGPLSSIKRKADGGELIKRELTLVDATAKTVVLTLWGRLAETDGGDLEARTKAGGAVTVAVRGCRVGDYGGVSLSTLGRSSVSVDPPTHEADDLKAWYAAGGRTAPTEAAGAGLATTRGAPGGAGRDGGRCSVRALQPVVPQAPGAKATFASVLARFCLLKADKMWYDACPGDGCKKKVVASGSEYRCEGCAKAYPTFTRRYMLKGRVCDATGDCWVSLFDGEATALLGVTADGLAAEAEVSKSAIARRLAAAQWGAHVLRIKVSSQEYQGEARLQYGVAGLAKPDWAAEARTLQAAVAAMATGGAPVIKMDA